MKKLSMMTCLMIPVGIAINVVCRQITQTLGLPIFLDTIGTILVGILTGPLGGVITGVLTSVVRGMTVNPIAIYFAPVGGVVGLIAGICSKNKFINDKRKLVVIGVLIALAGILVATPITVLVFGGADGSGSSLVTGAFLAATKNIWQAVFSSKLITETADKFLALITAIYIIKKIPNSTLIKFDLGENLLNKGKETFKKRSV